MTLLVRKQDGVVIEVHFWQNASEGISIDQLDLPMEEFLSIALHVAVGGFNGWTRGVPPAVDKFLTDLNIMYHQVDGKWVRQVPFPT